LGVSIFDRKADSETMRLAVAVYVLVSVSGFAPRQSRNAPLAVDWLTPVGDKETFSAARLTAEDQKDILAQVEGTSFDVPDSWSAELRVRRISLGTSQGLIIRSTRLLCGGTGNCQTWVFRRTNARWRIMITGDAPIGASIGFVRHAKKIRDLIVTTNQSAEVEVRTRYVFDGEFYRETECFRVSASVTGDSMHVMPCA
jgi:hypothetical protein